MCSSIERVFGAGRESNYAGVNPQRLCLVSKDSGNKHKGGWLACVQPVCVLCVLGRVAGVPARARVYVAGGVSACGRLGMWRWCCAVSVAAAVQQVCVCAVTSMLPAVRGGPGRAAVKQHVAAASRSRAGGSGVPCVAGAGAAGKRVTRTSIFCVLLKRKVFDNI